jgi:hypothetical protein
MKKAHSTPQLEQGLESLYSRMIEETDTFKAFMTSKKLCKPDHEEIGMQLDEYKNPLRCPPLEAASRRRITHQRLSKGRLGRNGRSECLDLCQKRYDFGFCWTKAVK